MMFAPMTIDQTALSDLFFNHYLAHRDALYADPKSDPSDEELAEALFKDADEFVACLNQRFTYDERLALIAWLVSDFNRRL